MKESDVTERLKNNYTYLSEKLKNLGFNLLNTETSIIPIIVGDEYKLTQMSKDFYDKNIFLNYIFPPVVSPKLSRIRISVMANHTKEDLDYLINTIYQIGIQYKITQN